MTNILLDDTEIRNKVGQAILASRDNGYKSTLIVTPYLSESDIFHHTNHLAGARIICNAKANSSNPYVIQRLLKNPDIQIRSHSDIHAKVYSFGDCAFITSANATQNGLGTGTLEAGVKLNDMISLKKIAAWFEKLWSDKKTEDVRGFTQEEWRRLESNWNINKDNHNKKPLLVDLIRTKKLPNDVAFVFWIEIEDAPSKKKVLAAAESQSTVELPKDFGVWDYWIEGTDQSNEYNDLDKVLTKNYGKISINFKVKGWPFSHLYKQGSFLSRTLDKPIRCKHRGENLLLALYRTDNLRLPFKIDSESIDLINRSIKKNHSDWQKYFRSKEGKYGYCSVETLYSLIKDCV